MTPAGKVAVVTGGAGGLGRAVALRLGRGGCRLALWDRDPAALDRAVAELGRRGAEARGYVVDVADPASVREAARRVRSELGDPDILDNNAGVVVPGTFLESDAEGMRRTVDVNLMSYLWCTREFLPAMVRRGSGHLIMIASAAGLTGVPGLAVYAATKHAVVGFAESLRLELRGAGARGIGMTIVCPSFIATGMFDGVKPPRGTRWLTPDEVADRVLRAMARGRLYVREPLLVKLLAPLKALPVGVSDWLGDLTGMHEAARAFKGGSRKG